METPEESRFVVNSVPTTRTRDIYARFVAGESSHALARAENVSQTRIMDLCTRMRIVHEQLANEQMMNSPQ